MVFSPMIVKMVEFFWRGKKRSYAYVAIMSDDVRIVIIISILLEYIKKKKEDE